MKTGCTSGKKKQGFSFNSVCTVFEPFKIEHFQSILTVWYLHNCKRIPYEDFHIFAVMDSASIFSGNERIEVFELHFFLIFVSQKQLVNVLITEKKKNDNGNVQKRSTTHKNGAH